METAVTRLARWAVECPGPHSEIALQRAGTAVLDTVACMIAGASADVTRRTAQAITGLGSGPCTTIGMASMAAPWAALLNGTAAHALDFDDYDFPAVSHPSAVLVPALLALGEELGSSGHDVLDAYVVGYEAMACVGKAVNMVHYERGWHATATLGTLGATVACTRLARLDVAATAAALSLSTSMAAGFKSQFGTMAKPLHAGLAAKSGILAARLGQAGITASADTLDGPWSVLNLLAGPAARGFDQALARLGAPLAIEETGLVVKRFPTCGYTHRAIAALLQLRAAHTLDAAQVDRIEAHLPHRNTQVLPHTDPQTEAQARFSMQYCLACALLHGDVTESDFQPEAITRASVRALFARIELHGYATDPNGSDSSPDEPDRVQVFMRDGSCFEASVGHVPGSPATPLSQAELLGKLHQCVDPVIGVGGALELESALLGFAQLPGIDPVMRHLRRCAANK